MREFSLEQMWTQQEKASLGAVLKKTVAKKGEVLEKG